MRFKKISYSSLNARQQEAYNFQKVSAVLAEYGFTTIRLSDDWQNADFIAQHVDGLTFLKVQLKGRLAFNKKYLHKDLWICFPDAGHWFIYPHDETLQKLFKAGLIANTSSWEDRGEYHFPRLTDKAQQALEEFKL